MVAPSHAARLAGHRLRHRGVLAEQRQHARAVDELARVVGVVGAHPQAQGDPCADHGAAHYHVPASSGMRTPG